MSKKISIEPLSDGKTMSESLGFIRDSRTAVAIPDGVIISETVFQVEPQDLRPNPFNGLFKEESSEYFDTLRADIKERGILVPCIAKRNGVLLAGHNRRRISLELKLPRIPVQYVESELTPEQEKAFVIKDNLYRRQLTQEDRLNLYKMLFPDFDEKIKEETRGGDRKTVGSKENDSPLIMQGSEALTAANLTQKVRAAGVNVTEATVKKDLAKVRAQIKPAASPAPINKDRTRGSEPDALKAVRGHLSRIVRALDGANKKTVDAAIMEILETLEKIGVDARYSNQVKLIRKNMKV
jgi:ParB-like chromosome segregation protein Spo0J